MSKNERNEQIKTALSRAVENSRATSIAAAAAHVQAGAPAGVGGDAPYLMYPFIQSSIRSE